MTNPGPRVHGRSDGRRRWTTLPLPLSLSLALASALAGTGFMALAQKPVVLAVVDVKAVALGYRVSELTGRPVTNGKETVGKIEDFIVGRDKVLFAIISVGGFLGLGDRKVAVPYTSLRVAPDHVMLPGATEAELRALPEFRYG